MKLLREGRTSRSAQPPEGAHGVHRDYISRPRAAAAPRRLGDRAPRLSRAALRRRDPRQSDLLRLDRGAARAAARHIPRRDHRGRDDVRHRQQGSRPVGRLDIRPGGGGVRPTVRVEFPRPRHRPVAAALPAARRGHRAAERRAGHHPEGAGVHRDADDAVHRPRLRARTHPRPGDLLLRTRRRSIRSSSAWARPTPSASTTRSRSSPSSPSSAPTFSPRPAGATRPSPSGATRRRRSMPASGPIGCESAPT